MDKLGNIIKKSKPEHPIKKIWDILMKIEKKVKEGVDEKAQEYMDNGKPSNEAYTEAMFYFGVIDDGEYYNLMKSFGK